MAGRFLTDRVFVGEKSGPLEKPYYRDYYTVIFVLQVGRGDFCLAF